MKVKVVKTITELEALKERWKSLSVSVPENTDAFSGWEFTCAYLKFFKPLDWVVVAIFAENYSDIPVAIFPLQLFNVSLNNKLLCVCEPLGLRYCTYTEFQIQAKFRESVLKVLLDFMHRHMRCDVFLVGQLHEDSKTYLHLLETLPSNKVITIRRPALPYICAQNGDFESFFVGRKKSTLSDSRRCERRLTEFGKLELFVASGMEPLDKLVRELCLLSKNKFGDRHIHKIDTGWIDFFVDLANSFVSNGLVEFSALTLDSRIIASHLGFTSKGRRYYYLPAYDPEFKKYSPSKVLLAKLIEKTFTEKGIFCFGPGDFSYKEDWCQAVAELKIMWVFLDDSIRAELEPFIGWDKLKSWYR